MIGRILSQLAGRGRKVPRQGLLQLSSKNGNANYYKGKGVMSTGVHTSKGTPSFVALLYQASPGVRHAKVQNLNFALLASGLTLLPFGKKVHRTLTQIAGLE